jgi:hypothetical protein
MEKLDPPQEIHQKIIVLKNAILIFCIKGFPVGRKALLHTLENSHEIETAVAETSAAEKTHTKSRRPWLRRLRLRKPT